MTKYGYIITKRTTVLIHNLYTTTLLYSNCVLDLIQPLLSFMIHDQLLPLQETYNSLCLYGQHIAYICICLDCLFRGYCCMSLAYCMHVYNPQSDYYGIISTVQRLNTIGYEAAIGSV